MSKEKIIRKSISLSPEVGKYVEDTADKMGLSQSAFITLALNEYKKQEDALLMMDNFKDILAILEKEKDKQEDK